jgi:sialate O-acetylesterase
MKRLFLFAAMMACAFDSTMAVELRLHPLFSDQMVLQRDRPMPVYGEGTPGARVSVRFGAATATATVLPDGRWTATLPAVAAGGPHELEVAMAEKRIHLKNILTGDVWLGSGQSNMVWTFNGGILDKEQETANANHEQIRFFKVPDALAAKPKTTMPTDAKWQTCSPATVCNFSAVGYFFAREIHQQTGVPIGIIVSAIGGTPVESWMSPAAYAEFPNTRAAAVAELDARFGGWENGIEANRQVGARTVQLVTQSMDAITAGALEPGFDDSAWKATDLFDPPSEPNRIRWLRKKITLTAEQAAMPATLSLPMLNDILMVYLNGTKLTELWSKSCVVELPPGSLRAGDNLLAVRAGCRWTLPSFKQKPEEAHLRSKDGTLDLPLKDGWKLSDSMEPPLPQTAHLTDVPSCLFNGMIHPLVQSPLKGVIWYQGEHNSGNPAPYAGLFSAMIRDWRKYFHQDAMPFYFVQLANLGKPSGQTSNDGWPLLREAQAKALAVPATGMATAIDIGEADNIHPKNKQDVGRRLALHALAKTYGKSIQCDGPTYQKFEVRGNSLVIHFNHADGLQTTDGTPPKGFCIAGEDRVFYIATAVIDGTCVILSSDKVLSPVAARYAFAANPVTNLRNAVNLPVYPFRTDDWSQITSAD